MILIAYDGSENADHAIAVAAQLFPGAQAEVVHAWEPMTSAAARVAVYAMVDTNDDTFEREQAAAQETVTRGAERARSAGLEVSAVTVHGSGPIWATLVDRIEETSPDVVVMGTRGLTGLRGVLAGSVSHHVTAHSAVPVLTVPLRRS